MAANEPRSENFFQQERERAEKLVKAISAKLNLSYRNTENDDGQSDDHHHHHAIEAVSRHGESVVSDMLHHIRSDNTNNNNNIDRNIILLKELLEEEAQFGFTPRMILAGVPDVILYFVRLLRDAPHGEIHVEWNKQEKENPTNNNNNNTLLDYNYAATNSHLPLSNTTHHNNYTYNNNHNSMEEIPILPLEAFLPSLVRRQENGENNKDNKNVFSSTLVDVSDLLSAKAAVSPNRVQTQPQ
ncbi:hypothetical protein ADEAN_000440400 [Angomonas deanei]|uniref:Uncharacterized protein n=1 Tax=Angomonas deanei TaxID=59799 RepID=A0A7G2CAV3_9TRYP|nr:hypothetical protein ADEAN_000440400 [Angomonas deanei]